MVGVGVRQREVGAQLCLPTALELWAYAPGSQVGEASLFSH